jgi:simple sugar transport system ATP-binding protein
VLVAHNPTRGLDVRSSDFVRKCLLDFVQADGAVLLISSDLDELTQLCHRIAVMFRGRFAKVLERDAFDLYRIGSLMTGGGVPTSEFSPAPIPSPAERGRGMPGDGA